MPSSTRTSTPAALSPSTDCSDALTRLVRVMSGVAGTGTGIDAAPGPGVFTTTGLVVHAVASVAAAMSAKAVCVVRMGVPRIRNSAPTFRQGRVYSG